MVLRVKVLASFALLLIFPNQLRFLFLGKLLIVALNCQTVIDRQTWMQKVENNS